MKYFCVSDIHGFYDEFKCALGKAGFDEEDAGHVVCILGDAFDRGPQNVEVFEFMKKMDGQNRLIYIRGNHEDLLEQLYVDLLAGADVGMHHMSNGTVSTIEQFTGCAAADLCYRWFDQVVLKERMEPILDFIKNRAVDYAETGEYVLVHSTIPPIKNWRDADTHQWEKSRWGNPFLSAKAGILPEGKVLIFGHWHTSWAWSHIKQDRKEWPPKNRIDWQKSFEPYYGDGYIGLDGCTAYSGIVNVLVLEDE